MSNTWKVTGGIIVLVLIALGVWWYMSTDTDMNTTHQPAVTDQTMTQTTGTSNPAANTTGASASASASSDASLNQDASNIDAQMSGLGSDNASADNGLKSQ